MLDVVMLKSELTLVVNTLAKAVVTQVLAAAQRHSFPAQNPEAEEKLSALVDTWCVEAVEKILKMIESSGVKHGETKTGLTDPLGSDENPEEPVMKPNGADGGPSSSAEKTFILVYGSDAVDSRCLLVPLQSSSITDGEKGCGSTDVVDKVSSSPRRDDFPDHGYARPAARGGGAKKRRLAANRKPDAAVTAEPPHECPRCRMLFPNAERLSDHQRKAHPACATCGAVFTGVLKLRQHETQQHGLLPHACDYCAKRFNHKAHRDLHVKARHTGEKTCHCDVCGKGYSCVSVLKTHRLTHFDKTFICDVCGKGFFHACHLTRHKLAHQEVRPFRCATCGRGFTQAENLRSHQLVHGGERQLCAVCGKSFRCLRNHVISKHAHELPAEQLPARGAVVGCDVCGKKFPNQSQHRLHLRSHTGEKPHHCDVCGKSYRLKELLRDHRHTHTGQKPYSCSLCSKTFSLAASFARHRSIHSGQTPHSCADCGKHFRLLSFLKAHLQTKAHLRQAQQRQAATSDL